MTKRWLPVHVSEYRDRHGKARYRYRAKDFTCELGTEPGSADFLARLAAAKAEAAKPRRAGRSRTVPGSIDDLCARYYMSPRFRGLDPKTQASFRNVLDRFRSRRKKSGVTYGSLPAAAITTAHLDRLFGSMAETPGAASFLRKRLKALFRYAVKIGLRTDNPALETDGFKAGPGFHTWTDDEIAQFRARHPLGTKARLALELLLNTAARRVTVVTLARTDLRHGKFYVQHAKGGEATIVPALPETLAAIEAMPVAGIGTFLVTDYGKPFSVAGFGNWFRDRCNEAGLPHCTAHGVRKAISRRLAESGSTSLQGRAVTGHKKDETFNYYAEKANREVMADAAMTNLTRLKIGELRKGE